MKSPQNSCPDALLRASQQRVEELERALQDAYSWAYSDGELSKLNALMEEAAVPIPAEIVTRNRMIEVWKEGSRSSTAGPSRRRIPSPSKSSPGCSTTRPC